MRTLTLFTSLVILLVSCKDRKSPSKPDVLLVNRDSSINPAQNFFLYANGGWIKNNPIPDEQSSWGIGDLVVEETLRRLRVINEDAAGKSAAKGSPEQLIGDFWKAAMDSVGIEEAGLKMLQPYFTKIDEIRDQNSLISTVAELKRIGCSLMFSDFISQDAKNNEVMIYQLWQGGLALPDRDYYFETNEEVMNIRKEYEKYIARILTLSGEDSLQANNLAHNILSLETKLAESSRKLEDLRDPNRNYNKMAIDDLPKMAGNIDWKSFLTITGTKDIDSVIVGQPEFFLRLDSLIQTEPLANWKAYLKFNFIDTFIGQLPYRFGEASFSFNKLFSGATKRKARWKRVLSVEEDVMGEMLGQLYVKEFFTEQAKERYSNMVEAVKNALKDRIGKLTWMSDSTKEKAYMKLAAMKKKVGYPDKWKDFSSMKVNAESYFENMVVANEWWHNYYINKLGKPVDLDEWTMYPQTYNAYYNSTMNEIVLPAGIFVVPGYRDEELDDALMFGYVGASTIGHEIVHGFDDEGRQYDAKGNLSNWWTKKDEEEFKKRADVMVKQFDEFEPVKGMHINGKATLGENIADLGGVLIGMEAFRKTDQYKNNEEINGLTPAQRFYMGYSLGWLSHQREEVLRNQLLSDVHSPAKYRVNAPFANDDEFYKAFNVTQGDAMYRVDSLRVRIW